MYVVIRSVSFGSRHSDRCAEPGQALDASSWAGSWSAGLDNSMMRHIMPVYSAATLPRRKPLPGGDHGARLEILWEKNLRGFAASAARAQSPPGPAASDPAST